MNSKRHLMQEIANKLRQADMELGKGKTVADACKLLVITEAAYYR